MTDSNTVVVVFHMKDCPACEEYVPKFKKVAARHPTIPAFVLEANEHTKEADYYGVTNVPATFVLRKPQGMIKTIGPIPNDQIEWLFHTAEKHR